MKTKALFSHTLSLTSLWLLLVLGGCTGDTSVPDSLQKRDLGSSSIQNLKARTADQAPLPEITGITLRDNTLVLEGTHLSGVATLSLSQGATVLPLPIKKIGEHTVEVALKDGFSVIVGGTAKIIFESLGGAGEVPFAWTLPPQSLTVEQLAPSGATGGEVVRYSGDRARWEAQKFQSFRYQGTWDPRQGLPEHPESGALYILTASADLSTGGSGKKTEVWKEGDWLLFTGTEWQRLKSASAVTSVGGKSGEVVLSTSDLGQTDLKKNPPASGDILGWKGDTGVWGAMNLDWSAQGQGLSFDANQITSGTVPAAQLPNNVSLFENYVEGSEITSQAVTTAHLADGAVSGDKFPDGTISGSKVADGTLSGLQLQDGAITGDKLASGTLQATHLVDGAVASTALDNGSVTTAKIADASLTSAKFASGFDPQNTGDGSVSSAELNFVDGLTSSLQTQLDSKGTLKSLTLGNGLKGVDSLNAPVTTITQGSATLSVNTGTGANQILQLDSSGNLPAMAGSALGLAGATVRSGGLKLQDQNTPPRTVTLKAPAALSADVTYTLPDTPQAGQYLRTNGSGTLSWSTPSWNGDMLKATYDTDNDGVADQTPSASDATQLNGHGASYYRDLSNLTGTLSASRIDTGQVTNAEFNRLQDVTSSIQTQLDAKGTVSSVTAGTGLTGGTITTTGTLAVDMGTGANKVVQLGVGGSLPAVSGANLTNLAPGNISGTVPLASQATSFSGSLAGDVTGGQSSTVVEKIQGRSVASASPSNGDLLRWNGTSWTPTVDTGAGEVNTVTQLGAGTGQPYQTKSAANFQLRSVKANSTKMTVALGGSNQEIQLDVDQTQLDLGNMAGGPFAVASGGTGATTASAARTNLGIGTLATQSLPSVTITGGTLNNMAVGGTTPAVGTFTSLTFGGSVTPGGYRYTGRCPSTPYGYTGANGHCYMLVGRNLGFGWGNAAAVCAMWGGAFGHFSRLHGTWLPLPPPGRDQRHLRPKRWHYHHR